jgi:hypothetical protein
LIIAQLIVPDRKNFQSLQRLHVLQLSDLIIEEREVAKFRQMLDTFDPLDIVERQVYFNSLINVE